MIAIIDYGMGNLRSVQKAFENLNCQAIITRDEKTLRAASHLVLPGVGAFPDGISNLEKFGLIPPLRDQVRQGTPLLGICLGMQLLFRESEEFGLHQGLDLIPGRVVRFPESGPKVPHMGWNQIKESVRSPLLEGAPSVPYVYFVHSYYAVPDDSKDIATTTDYGLTFTSSVHHDHIFACQFHPEKSQQVGLKLLENFARQKGGPVT